MAEDLRDLMEWDLYHKLEEMHPDAPSLAGELVKRAQPWGTVDIEKLGERYKHVTLKMEYVDVEEAMETFQELTRPGDCLLNEDSTLELVAMWSMREGLGSQETGMLLAACLHRLHLLKLLKETEDLLKTLNDTYDLPSMVEVLREKIKAVMKKPLKELVDE